MQKVMNRALGLILVIALAALCMVPALADKPMNTGKWYDDGMNEFIDKGYITGYGNGEYGPERSMTRAEFIAVVNKFMNYTEANLDAAAKFKDMDSARWYYKPIAIALKAGYVKGNANGTMAPNAIITRQEAVTMLVNIKGLELKSKEDSRKDLQANEAGFKDVADVPNWAVDYMAAAVADGIVTGSKDKSGMNLNPKKALTRAEGVYMIMHLAEAEEEAVYAIMNIPYSEFYAAEGTENIDLDAVTAATDKVGNYSITGGGYHSGVTATKDEAGEWAAAGAANNAKMEGVTWPVKASSLEDLKALGGEEITADSAVTVAEAHHGAVGTFDLKGAQTLMEAPSYSCYVLDEAPAQAMKLTVKDGKASFSKNEGDVTKAEKAELQVQTGTHWGDVQLGFPTDEEGNSIVPKEIADMQCNAVMIVTEKGAKAGMVHLDNIWTKYQIAWSAKGIKDMDGDTITSILWYCNDKEGSYYVVEIPVSAAVPPIYQGTVTASFDGDKAVKLEGLPSNIKNPTAVISFAQRGAETVYLTETTIDPADGDVEAVKVAIKDGKVDLTTAPTAGTTYSVVISSDNYGTISTTVAAAAAEGTSGGSGSGSGSGNHSGSGGGNHSH